MADHAGPASAVRPVQAVPPRQLAVPWLAVAALAAVAWGVTVMLARTVAFAALAGSGRLLTASPTAAKWLGVAIFTAAGVYQLTAWKDWCLRRCRSPIGALMYYLGFKGRSRDLRVGLHHGATCAG